MSVPALLEVGHQHCPEEHLDRPASVDQHVMLRQLWLRAAEGGVRWCSSRVACRGSSGAGVRYGPGAAVDGRKSGGEASALRNGPLRWWCSARVDAAVLMCVVCGAGVWLPSPAYMRRPLFQCVVCGAGVWLPSPAYMRRPVFLCVVCGAGVWLPSPAYMRRPLFLCVVCGAGVWLPSLA